MKIAIVSTNRTFGKGQDLSTANFKSDAAYKEYLSAQGWGACEALIVSYARAWHRQGHQVKIITNPIMGAGEIVNFQPDFGFVIHTAELFHGFPPSTKCIVYQSHRECLLTPNAWDDNCKQAHHRVATAMATDPRIIVAALSPEIKEMYCKIWPQYKDRVIVQDNPIDVDCFKHIPSGEPRKFSENGLFVAQIGPRKNQAAYAHIDNIHFVGPPFAGGFQNFPFERLIAANRYHGAWSRKQILNNYCEYGCGCLFSKLEADVMVVKEAMAAGLAFVGNGPSLNCNVRHLPWIFNVDGKEHQIRATIQMASKATNAMSNEIRKWAEDNLDTMVKSKQLLKKVGME